MKEQNDEDKEKSTNEKDTGSSLSYVVLLQEAAGVAGKTIIQAICFRSSLR